SFYEIKLNTTDSKKIARFAKASNPADSNIASENFPVLLRDFTRIFPYHICFDRNLIIEHVGTFLLNEYNLANKKGLHLQDVVELLQPTAAKMEFASFLEHANTRFFVRIKVPGNRGKEGDDPVDLQLSGQMMPLASGNSIVFLCSP
ncbi:hypothetical protein PMAYCL1PPCAC_14981, partial [Pristionchus mayeri]